MLRYLKPLPAFQPVAAGNTASVQLPLGPTYRYIHLIYRKIGVLATAAQIAADITMIRLKINGIVRQSFTGAELRTLLHAYYGNTLRDGELPLHFARPWARTVVGEDALQLGTRNVDTVTLEVDIDAAAGAVTLEGFAWTEPVQNDLGAMVQVHRFPITAGAAGDFEWSTFPQTNGALMAFHLQSALITGVTAKLNDIDFSTADLSVWNAIQVDQGRVPQTNVVHIEPPVTGRIDDVWPLRRLIDRRLILTMSGAGTVNVLMETLSTPNVDQQVAA